MPPVLVRTAESMSALSGPHHGGSINGTDPTHYCLKIGAAGAPPMTRSVAAEAHPRRVRLLLVAIVTFYGIRAIGSHCGPTTGALLVFPDDDGIYYYCCDDGYDISRASPDASSPRRRRTGEENKDNDEYNDEKE
eukprot:GHVU01096740.1.p2 GENE.GHVU01096740.1~~GHVU01096740.1.p2  ORF type:complete len:135 (+),score=23.01 GHVU01096740.1:265-669(+)